MGLRDDNDTDKKKSNGRVCMCWETGLHVRVPSRGKEGMFSRGVLSAGAGMDVNMHTARLLRCTLQKFLLIPAVGQKTIS